MKKAHKTINTPWMANNNFSKAKERFESLREKWSRSFGSQCMWDFFSKHWRSLVGKKFSKEGLYNENNILKEEANQWIYLQCMWNHVSKYWMDPIRKIFSKRTSIGKICQERNQIS